MTHMKTPDSLEVDEDPEFERREWTVQRIGWVLMFVFVLAALAGLFGHGPAARERMEKSRVGESDILEAARRLQGLARLDQIAYAVLERNGGITIVPKDNV